MWFQIFYLFFLFSSMTSSSLIYNFRINKTYSTLFIIFAFSFNEQTIFCKAIINAFRFFKCKIYNFRFFFRSVSDFMILFWNFFICFLRFSNFKYDEKKIERREKNLIWTFCCGRNESDDENDHTSLFSLSGILIRQYNVEISSFRRYTYFGTLHDCITSKMW